MFIEPNSTVGIKSIPDEIWKPIQLCPEGLGKIGTLVSWPHAYTIHSNKDAAECDRISGLLGASKIPFNGLSTILNRSRVKDACVIYFGRYIYSD